MKRKENDDIELINLEKQKKIENIKGILFLVWFVITIGLMILFADLGYDTLCICIFGHYFAVFGFVAMVSSNPSHFEEKIVPTIFMLVGITIMIICLLIHFGIINFN